MSSCRISSQQLYVQREWQAWASPGAHWPLCPHTCLHAPAHRCPPQSMHSDDQQSGAWNRESHQGHKALTVRCCGLWHLCWPPQPPCGHHKRGLRGSTPQEHGAPPTRVGPNHPSSLPAPAGAPQPRAIQEKTGQAESLHQRSPLRAFRENSLLPRIPAEQWLWAWGAGAQGCPEGVGPQACSGGPERQGGVAQACQSLLTGSLVGIPCRGHPIVWGILIGKGRRPFSQTSASPRPSLELGFPQGGEGQCQKTGPPRRGRLCLHTAGPEPAPTGSCVCVHRWLGGLCSARVAPARPASLPASLLPSCPLFLPSFFSPNRCLEDVHFVLQTCAGQQDFNSY